MKTEELEKTMTSYQHKLRAEELIRKYRKENEKWPVNGRISEAALKNLLTEAQVHATLASGGF